MAKIQVKFSNAEFLEPYVLLLPYVRRITKSAIENKLEDEIAKLKVSKELPPETIYINFVNSSEIKKMNLKYRKKDSPTDVLSFPADKGISEVYICPDFVEKNAEKFNVAFEEELIRVTIHGILHLLGYDHRKSFSIEERSGKLERMFSVQEKIINSFYNSKYNSKK